MSDYLEINPNSLSVPELQGYLQGAIAPRPIAFASTVDAEGRPNLAPFSFFNLFSTRPPVLVFAPNRSGRTGQHKHTYLNAKATGQVVINVVSYDMVQQTSLASTEYPAGVNEFEKAGFTPLASVQVRPARVAQSPVQLECKVLQTLELADTGGSGQLIICEVLLLHIHQRVLDEKGRIDPQKIDLVARLGADYYCRASGSAIFTVAKPLLTMGIGVDNIPERIRKSEYLVGNDLGMLGNVEQLPNEDEVANFHAREINGILRGLVTKKDWHRLAHLLLEKGEVHTAWLVLLAELNHQPL